MTRRLEQRGKMTVIAMAIMIIIALLRWATR